MGHFIKTYLVFISLFFVMVSTSGCVGDSSSDFQNLIEKLFPDEDTSSSTDPTNNQYANYKLVTNAE